MHCYEGWAEHTSARLCSSMHGKCRRHTPSVTGIFCLLPSWHTSSWADYSSLICAILFAQHVKATSACY